MKSLHLRKIDDDLMFRLKQMAEDQKMSINSLILSILRYGLGLAKKRKLPTYNDLDALIGTWNEEDLKEFQKNTTDFGKIDEGLWK